VKCVHCFIVSLHGSQGSNSQPLVMLSKLTSAISVKQKLIDELSEKQRSAKRMTQQYDEQLNQLEQAIHQMQTRRDQELAKLSIYITPCPGKNGPTVHWV